MGWNQGTNPLPLVLASDLALAIRLACEHDLEAGSSYDIVGEVQMSAREYVHELAQALERPVTFQRSQPPVLQAMRMSRWALKRMLARSEAPHPSYRSLKSMGFPPPYNSAPTKRVLGWSPVSDRAEFIDRGLRIHRERFQG